MKEFAVIFYKQSDDTVLSATSAVNKHLWEKYICPQVELRKTCGERNVSEARKISAKREKCKRMQGPSVTLRKCVRE